MVYPIYDVVLQDDTEGIYALSLVSEPAIEREFIAHQNKVKLFHASEDFKYLTGPILIPNQLILRKAEDGSYFYIRYSKEVIKQLRDKFFENSFHKNLNLEHDSNRKVNGTIVESYLVKADQATDLIPEGTFMVTVKPSIKIDNEFLSKFKGFSIEAVVNLIKTDMSKKLKQSQIVASLEDGTMVVWDDQTFEIWYEADMTPLPDGEYTFSDGTVITVVNGIIQTAKNPTNTPNDDLIDELKKELQQLKTELSKIKEDIKKIGGEPAVLTKKEVKQANDQNVLLSILKNKSKNIK
jgi:hypothetical protein